jgi:hypothetical protein
LKCKQAILAACKAADVLLQIGVFMIVDTNDIVAGESSDVCD